MVQLQAIDNIFQDKIFLSALPIRVRLQTQSPQSGIQLCLALSRVRVVSVHSEDLLNCEPGHSTPCLPSA